MLILINRCLLNVIVNTKKALHGQNSFHLFIPLPHFGAIWKVLLFLMLVSIFFHPSLFHIKLYKISPAPTPVVISWLTS